MLICIDIIAKERAMEKEKITKKKRRIDVLRRRLGALGPMMRGSVVLIGSGKKQFYFSVNIKGKTNLIYLGKDRVKRAREYSANYKKHLEIIEEMTILNMELLKEDAFS